MTNIKTKHIWNKIKCYLGYHDWKHKQKFIGYWMGIMKTYESTYTCKKCGKIDGPNTISID